MGTITTTHNYHIQDCFQIYPCCVLCPEEEPAVVIPVLVQQQSQGSAIPRTESHGCSELNLFRQRSTVVCVLAHLLEQSF